MTHVEPGVDTLACSSVPSPRCLEPSHNFEELALPLFDSICGFAYLLAGRDGDAEDLVQETYLKALRGFEGFEANSNFRAWMFRILKNTFLTSRVCARYRYLSPMDLESLGELRSDFPDPVTTLMDRGRFDAIHAAIERLPVIFREVMVLCDLEEASYRETAHALSIPVGTVMSRLSRARKAVRASIHAMHGTAAGAYSFSATRN